MGLVDQLGHPQGWVGALLLPLLNATNGRLMRGCLNAAALQGGERVLDIGFGGGALLRAARKTTRAPVFGLDRSAIAARRSAGFCAVQGDAAQPPFAAGGFDAVFLVNVVYFLPEPVAVFGAVRRLLTPNGRLIVGYEERDPLGATWSPERLAPLFAEAGLHAGPVWKGGRIFASSASPAPHRKG